MPAVLLKRVCYQFHNISMLTPVHINSHNITNENQCIGTVHYLLLPSSGEQILADEYT